MEDKARAAARHFALDGEARSVEPYGSGNIHDTFRVSCGRRYILQRLSLGMVADPRPYIENSRKVMAHLRAKVDEPRRRLTAVDAADGRGYWQDEDGAFWRAFDFIEDTVSRDVIDTPEQAGEAAKAFGFFSNCMKDLPPRDFAAPLPHFHDTPKRFLMFERALANDEKNRAADAKSEVEFALARKDLSGVLVAFQERGDIPERIVHNDTKVNNVLFDAASGEGMCVVDLDTVMPGLVLYDFGDLVRSAVSDTAEDERDLSRVGVRMPVYAALARGFLEAKGGISRLEQDYMAFSAKLIALELGMRFLTDYLNGDVYFKTVRPEQNLDRCRAQFALARDIERKEEAMSRIVEGM
ncbi:MAG: aminoglycoside phosphotransferase family protein [Elusimicrobiota bacterium]